MSRRIDCADVDQRCAERGYATVWVITAMGLVVAACMAAIGYAAAVERRHRAAAAADAAALDAALHAIDGAPTACAQGARLARENNARLTRCVLDGAIASVTVAVVLPGPLSAFGPATAQARAGPVSVVS